MFLVGLFTWWYGRGWQGQLLRVRERLRTTFDFFSIGQLLGTLFAPYRQISAGRAKGSLAVLARAVVDQLISRVIGAIIRLFTILAGVVVLALLLVFEALIIAFWVLLPLFPVIGLLMMAIGWVPQWR